MAKKKLWDYASLEAKTRARVVTKAFLDNLVLESVGEAEETGGVVVFQHPDYAM